MNKGKVIIISGPSGSGKTTLYRKLLACPKFKGRLLRSVSVTTRPKRSRERHGRDYVFVSPRMFAYKKKAGHFLESEKVFGNYYGTPAKSIRDCIRSGKNVLLCIDVKGAITVQKKFPKAVTIFIKTSSMSTLKTRLKKRGTENHQDLRLRLSIASNELREERRYAHVVINDHLKNAYNRLETIISRAIG